MSSLYVRVTVNQERTHRMFAPAMAAHLRSLADQVESAVGPIDLTTDWADIEAWSLPEADLPPLPPLAEAELPGRRESNPGWPPQSAG
jgi:hypothetical protein